MRPHTIAATLALLAVAVVAPGAPLRVAIVPPQDYEPTTSQLRAMGQALGIDVDLLTPQQLIDPGEFSPAQYPLAAYAGGERYCHSVAGPGDGSEALLRYVSEGGILLVAGMCWPFYRPVDYVTGDWTPSTGAPPRFTGDTDQHLLREMARLNQSSVGNLNRYFGLNVAGEGTLQFEAPPEKIEFRVVSERFRPLGLPERFPFPASGDLRYRPVSPRHGLPDATFEPVLTAVGESGVDYGPGMAVVRIGAEGELTGTVIYVWGTLMTTSYGPAILREVIRAAARETSTMEDRKRVGDLRRQVADLADRRDAVARDLTASPADTPARGYLIRESAHLAGIIEGLEDTILVRNFDVAQTTIGQVTEMLAALESRAKAVTAAG